MAPPQVSDREKERERERERGREKEREREDSNNYVRLGCLRYIT
jgi:hypothetical protein